MSCCSGWAQWLCYASSPPQGRAHHKDRVAQLERAPPAAPHFWRRQGLRPHIVISTKFQEPWFTYSQDLKVLLIELGCTVYNPNTDTAERYTEEANDRWLRTFNENLEQVKRTKGFVLQVQQGVSHEKSHMQVAEQQSAWLNVPRIALFIFEGGRIQLGCGILAKKFMETALVKAEEQWTNGVEAELQMCSQRFEPVDGADKVPTDSRGNVHGMAKCTYPDGNVYVGEWQHGKIHGHGTYNYADGAVYVGNFQHGDKHGQGTLTWADGAVYVGGWKHAKMHGQGKMYSAAERAIAGNTKKEAQELPSFVAYEQDGVLLEMAESIELKYKPRLEISEKLHDKVVSMLPDGVRLLSPIVSLTPEGEKFNPPIRCIFPASNGAAKAFRATAGRLEELEEAIFHGGYCEVSLDHFSCVFAVGSPLPLVATGYLRSESKVGKIVFCTLNCERCEKIVKHQKDFEEGVNSFRACGEPVVLGLTSLNESVKLLHDKTELKIEQVDPTCPRLPPFVSTDFLVGGPEPENGAFTIQVERDSTVTYKHLFQFSFPTLHAEPQASSSSTGPNQMVPLVLGMPQRTHLMLSGRFSTPEKCEYMKSLKGVLEGKGVHCYLVEAGPGDEFGFQTMEGLACAKAMLAVCCEEYGAYTGAGYETYYEVKYAWDHKLPIIPLRLCEVYPPQPERRGAIQNGFIFHKSLVRIEGRGRSIQEVAVDIEKSWKRIAKLTQVSL